MMTMVATRMKIEMDMVMAKKENTTIGMMTGMVNTGIRMVVMLIVTVKNGMAEMDIGMMTIREEVEALMVMGQEAGAPTEIEIGLSMTMVNPHLGNCSEFFIGFFITFDQS
jgi:hypothetical protein